MRILLPILALFLALAPVTAQPDTPQATVETFFTSLSSGEYETALVLLESSTLATFYESAAWMDSTLTGRSPQDGLADLFEYSAMFKVALAMNEVAVLGEVPDPDGAYTYVVARYYSVQGQDLSEMFGEPIPEELQSYYDSLVNMKGLVVTETADGWRILVDQTLAELMTPAVNDRMMGYTDELERAMRESPDEVPAEIRAVLEK